MKMQQEIIHIVFICDENYVMPTSVAILSLVKNKEQNTCYNIYIVTSNLNEQDKLIFTRFNSDLVKIIILETELGELENLHIQDKNSYCVATPAALLKFCLPNILEISKVLYLDGDVIIRSDLSELFETDLEDNYAGVVVDSGILYSKNMNVKKYKNYFNSGVMLLNLDKMREADCTDKLIYEKKYNNQTGLMDQNVFNKIFEKKVKLLSIKYNCLYINLVRSNNKFTLAQLNERYQENFVSLEELAEKAYIIHYSSKDKPWKYYDIPLANEWYMYYLQMCNLCMINSSKLERNSSVLGKNDLNYREKYRPDIIVSLTTYPARVKFVHIPIEEMLNQTIKADKVILWLAKEQFPNLENDLPDTLIDLQKRGLSIRWCDEDLKSHKKYFYAIQEFKESIIITIDDDLHYTPYLLEILLDSYKKYPRAVSAMRTHLMIQDKNDMQKIAPYSEWKKEYSSLQLIPSMQLFATSGAGTLFPPYCMNEEVFNKEVITTHCLYADDILLKIAQVMYNTPVVLADIHQRLTYVEGTQDEGLWKENVDGGRNDLQLENLLKLYNKVGCSDEESIVRRIFDASLYPNKLETGLEKDKKYSIVIKELQETLYNIEKSKSYRIGRTATFIPRKVLSGILCYRENGAVYTIKRVKEKIVNKLKK